jgi:hypothetical protein
MPFAFLAVAAALAAAAPAAMPAGGFTCERLMVESFNGAGEGDYLPSVLGSFTLDGKGGYVHPAGAGRMVLDKGLLRFTEGTMKGIVASQRKDAKGRIYLLIDKSITDPPGAKPRMLDAVCYKT